MPLPHIVVVGASAGGLVALRELTAQLPADLHAAVFVVLHTAPGFNTRLADFLDAAGPLPARFAEHASPIVAGTITVALADRHLVIRADHVELSRGPRENHARPAVDVSLRTAAQSHGARVIGVVLSGTMGDGTMGLMAVKAHRGTAIVQDPAEAAYAGMPESAIRYTAVDQILPVAEIARYLGERAGKSAGGKEDTQMEDASRSTQSTIDLTFSDQVAGQRNKDQTVYTCPDCGGILWQQDEDGLTGFRCYQGHAYGGESLLSRKSDAVEDALWSATRALVERATMNRQLAAQMRKRGLDERAVHLEEQAAGDERHIALLRNELLGT